MWQLSRPDVGRVVCEVYYSRLRVTLCTRVMQDIICTAGPYASHDLARKNTMKPSATHHAALERCGESRRSNTLTVTSSLSYKQCLQANRLYRDPV